ncbi:MAG: CotH kinase family protein [Eubacterium sp.]|nr:CotH kinase family protein [Eubacterium sp.]
MTIAAILCLFATVCRNKLTELLGGTTVKMEYESKLFNTDKVIDIDIRMKADEWDKMLENAMTEEYYVCDVVINGQKFRDVAIRPKGNTSLMSIANDPDTDRYSMKLEFDHFVEGQTCYGLDKLILNNNYADATNMKEAAIYDMFHYLGAEASLTNYAKVSLNGEYRGVYLALEGVEQSFMLRNFGTQDGELYKPESMGMGENGGPPPPPPGGFDPNMPPPPGGFDPNMPPPPGGFDPNNMATPEDAGRGNIATPGDATPGDAGQGMMPPPPPGMAGKGADLNYSDDDLDSYATIWAGEVSGTSKGDHRRVVTALKNISEGKDLEEYLDVDNVLKYMAVHTFSVNMDSLSGNMSHNYYLYEYEGKLNFFPWDYNLSLGGMPMMMGNMDGNGGIDRATSMVNDAIDTPFSGTKFFDALLSDEEYLERYHAYMQKLVDEYVDGGKFEEFYSRSRSQIDSLVKDDPTAFYNFDEYSKGVEVLRETIKLRANSIEGQLAGTIPSTDDGQKEDSSMLVDASHIDVKAMGEFGMGGPPPGAGGFGGKMDNRAQDNKVIQAEVETEIKNKDKMSPPPGGDSDPDDRPAPPEGFDPGSMPPPEGSDPGSMPPPPEGFDPENMPAPPEGVDPGNMPGKPEDASTEASEEKTEVSSEVTTEAVTEVSTEKANVEKADNSDISQIPGGPPGGPPGGQPGGPQGVPPGMPGQPSGNTISIGAVIIFAICFILMLAALLIVKRIKRRKI